MKSIVALRMIIRATGCSTATKHSARTIAATVVMPISRTSLPGLRRRTRGTTSTPMTAPMPTTPEISPMTKVSVTSMAWTIEGTKKITP